MPIADWFKRTSQETEERHTFKQPDKWSFMGSPSVSGLDVTEQSALGLSAVYSCVRIISESLAALPLVTYRNTRDGRRRATDLAIYDILHDQADDNLSAFMLVETIVSHACTYGNGYAYISRNRAGQVTGLTPVDPSTVEVKLTESGRVAYEVNTGQFQGAWSSDEVLHIRALGPLGLVGYSPVGLARQTIGLGLASERYGAAWFGNSGTPSGILSVPGKMSDEAFQNLRRSWEKLHRGSANSARVALLEAGVEFKPISVTPEDAQFLETRRFQVAEVARIFRVPPSMLADLENAGSYGSIGELNRAFVVHTLTPWARRIESEIRLKLLPSSGDVFSEFQFDHLLRGDLEKRFGAYQVARQAGFLSVNDIRKIENLDPIGEAGDRYLSPLNMEALVPGQDPGEPAEAMPEARALDEVSVAQLRDEARAKTRATWLQALEGIAQDEQRAVLGQLEKNPDELDTWAKRWFDQDYQRLAFRQVLPALDALAEAVRLSVQQEIGKDPGSEPLAGLENIARRFATRRSARSRASLVGAEDKRAAVESWAEAHTQELVEDEQRRAEGALVLEAFKRAQVAGVTWRSSGPGVWSIDGETVKPGEPFVTRGQVVTNTDGQSYEARTDIRHTPLLTGDASYLVAKL